MKRTKLIQRVHIAPILLLLVIGPLLSCASSQKSTSNSYESDGIPNWVNDPSTAFSDRTYLMAVGSGDSFNDARADAMLSLAQIFRSQIEGTQNLYSDFEETTRNKTDFTSNETIRLMNNISIGASEELLNTEVLQSEVGSDGSYYVLAGMNRRESQRVYNQEIVNNYQKIRANQTSVQQTESQIRKLGILNENMLLARVIESLNAQLDIISPGSSDNQTAIQILDETQQEFRSAQELSIVQISMRSYNQVIRDAVAQAFQREGFIIGDVNPILKVSVTYDASEADLNRDDAEFVIWTLSISIEEIESAKRYNTFSTRGRDGAISLDDAYKRAEFTAGKEIESKFTRFINEEVFSNQ